MFKTIVCPLDGSDHSKKAFSLAIDLAKAGGSTLVVIHALMATAGTKELARFAALEGLEQSVQPAVKRLAALEGRLDYGFDDDPVPTRMFVEIGEQLLDDAKREAESAGVTRVESVLAAGDPAGQILRCIDQKKADCVVMGSRGLSDVSALFLGSVSHKITNQAPCTCIAVK